MSDDKKTRKLALALFATDPQVVAYLERNGEVVPFTLTTLEKAWKRGVSEKKPEGPWVAQALVRAKAMLDTLGRIEEAQKPKTPGVSGPPTYQNVEGLMMDLVREADEATRVPATVTLIKARDRHGSFLEVGDIVSSTDGSFYGEGRVAFIKSSGVTVCYGRHMMNSSVHLPGERLSLVRRKLASL